MKIDADTPNEYFSKTGEREPALRDLDELIRTEAPGLEQTMVSGMAMNMVGYGLFHYKSKSGREGDWPVVALANQKNYISLYICATEEGEYIAEKNAHRLGKVSVGKSCIRFKKLEDLNLDVVREILQTLEARKSRGEVLYGM
jgi:hypothetical protein